MTAGLDILFSTKRAEQVGLLTVAKVSGSSYLTSAGAKLVPMSPLKPPDHPGKLFLPPNNSNFKKKVVYLYAFVSKINFQFECCTFQQTSVSPSLLFNKKQFLGGYLKTLKVYQAHLDYDCVYTNTIVIIS